MNKIEVIGNIGRDAVIKELNGKQYATFSIADSHKQGQETTTTWFDVTTGNTALAPYLTRGKRMFVRGRLSPRMYVNKQAQPGLSLGIWASEIEFCGGGESRQQGQQAAPVAQQPVPAYQQFQQPQQQPPQQPPQQPQPLSEQPGDLPF